MNALKKYITSYGNYIDGRKYGVLCVKKIVVIVNNYLDDEIICPTIYVIFYYPFEIRQIFKYSTIVFSYEPDELTIHYYCRYRF